MRDFRQEPTDSRESYVELFTVGGGFVHILDEPLLEESRRERRRRLWIAAISVWVVAGLCVVALAAVLALGAARGGDVTVLPEEQVLTQPIEAPPPPAPEVAEPAVAELSSLPACSEAASAACDGSREAVLQ